MSTAAAMLVALAVEGAIGWPERLFRAIGHPVTWIGRLISWLDHKLNLDEDDPRQRRTWGLVALAVVLAATVLPALFVTALLPGGWLGLALTGLLAAPLVAPRSMYTHVADVIPPLQAGDLPAARRAVGRIVGRRTDDLGEAAISRAALESLAENTSDGIVAPVFWGVLLGLPGIAAYKAINTADSMIGHKSDRHLHFGRAAARLDDAVNWIPARATALLFAAVGPAPFRAMSTTLRDAPRHRSPNAGWPEAAMAAALGVRLSGPRHYDTGPSNDPFLNAEGRDPGADDIARGLKIYLRALGLLALALALLTLT